MVSQGNAPWRIPFYLVGFFFHAFQQMSMSEVGLSWHPSHTMPEAGACVLVTPVLLTGIQLLMRPALCPLLSHNAETMWMLRAPDVWQINSNSAHMGLEWCWGAGKVFLFWYRTGLDSVINRDLNIQIQDMIFKSRTVMTSLPLSRGNGLFNCHPSHTTCMRKGSEVSETWVCFLKKMKMKVPKKDSEWGWRACVTKLDGVCKLVSGSCPKCKLTGA